MNQPEVTTIQKAAKRASADGWRLDYAQLRKLVRRGIVPCVSYHVDNKPVKLVSYTLLVEYLTYKRPDLRGIA